MTRFLCSVAGDTIVVGTQMHLGWVALGFSSRLVSRPWGRPAL